MKKIFMFFKSLLYIHLKLFHKVSNVFKIYKTEWHWSWFDCWISKNLLFL